MNTSKPIALSYTWDRANFEKAFENAYTHQYKHSARRYIGWLFVAMAQFGVVAAMKGGSVGLLMLSTILIVYWYVVKKHLVYSRALKAFEHSPLKDRRITLQIDSDGVSQNGVEVPWEEIQGVVPVEDDILLYYQNNAFYIPSTAFGSLEEKSALKSMAKAKGRLFHV
ncbi:MAG: hypothetical protein L3J47_03480 [Sulfurovum sp.]|nr:hypothetical protein [Sulfurovum sp.]